MNQKELIDAIAINTGNKTGAVKAVLEALAHTTQSELMEGGEITLPGIGKLSVDTRAARKGRNPKTGEEIDIPARNVPKFTAAKALKNAVNEPQH